MIALTVVHLITMGVIVVGEFRVSEGANLYCLPAGADSPGYPALTARLNAKLI